MKPTETANALGVLLRATSRVILPSLPSRKTAKRQGTKGGMVERRSLFGHLRRVDGAGVDRPPSPFSNLWHIFSVGADIGIMLD
jgi:hypothetical protein